LRIADFGLKKSSNFSLLKLPESITPPQADGVCKGIMLSLPSHPTPLPRERELAETPPQAAGVLKTLVKLKLFIPTFSVKPYIERSGRKWERRS